MFISGVQKINQKNTWELNLIDHLCEIVKVEEEDDTETNFQKVFCFKSLVWSYALIVHWILGNSLHKYSVIGRNEHHFLKQFER